MEKTCEMVYYLWFSSSLEPLASRHRSHARCTQGGGDASDALTNGGSANRIPKDRLLPYSPQYHNFHSSHSHTATLQFTASRKFVSFMQKLLKTTQVSQSMIVVSLHNIYHLKERNEFDVRKPGSEFRVAIVALMMVNEFVDE